MLLSQTANGELVWAGLLYSGQRTGPQGNGKCLWCCGRWGSNAYV